MKKMQAPKSHALKVGVFKKKKWPWLLLIVGALCPIVKFFTCVYEYLIAKCPFCDTFMQHLSPNLSTLKTMAFLFVVLAILTFIFLTFPKRSFVITACNIVYKKGGKKTSLPYSSIDHVDTFGKNGIVVFGKNEEIKIDSLKNRKEMYDALVGCIENNAKVMHSIHNIAPATEPEMNDLPISQLADGKIRYFDKLLSQGHITVEQFDKYVERALETK